MEIIMSKRENPFGWKNMLCNYTLCEFAKDSTFPLIISFLLCVMAAVSSLDIYKQLLKLLQIGISIVPLMAAFILTAYTIILSFFMGEKCKDIKDDSKGKELIENLNSSFAVCLFASAASIIVLVVATCIANMEFISVYSNWVNYSTYFIVCYLTVFSISVLVGIIIDIYNIGQTTIL